MTTRSLHPVRIHDVEFVCIAHSFTHVTHYLSFSPELPSSALSLSPLFCLYFANPKLVYATTFCLPIHRYQLQN